MVKFSQRGRQTRPDTPDDREKLPTRSDFDRMCQGKENCSGFLDMVKGTVAQATLLSARQASRGLLPGVSR